MKNFLPLLILLLSCSKAQVNKTINKEPLIEKRFLALPGTTVYRPDHVVFVFFENKGYSQIVKSSLAPYINSLIDTGTLFTNSHGVTHPSYPNYIAFFSGGTQSVTNDNCIDGTPKTSLNLYTELAGKGASFKWYSEGLPGAGSRVCSSGKYVEKHNPTTVFKNVSTSANQPLTALNLTDTSQFRNWPKVLCVTPNLLNDMHDGTIEQGDAWLQANFDKYVQWALSNNSMLVVYYDEDNKKEGNTIPVVIVGQHVLSHSTVSTLYDHYNWTKTIASWWGVNSWNSTLAGKAAVTGFYK